MRVSSGTYQMPRIPMAPARNSKSTWLSPRIIEEMKDIAKMFLTELS